MTWQAWMLYTCFALCYLKTITVGSEFNFAHWIKYGRAYTKWYFNRVDWTEYQITHSVPTRKEAPDADR